MAIAHATAHTIIRVRTSDDAIVMPRSIRKIETILCQYSDEYVTCNPVGTTSQTPR